MIMKRVNVFPDLKKMISEFEEIGKFTELQGRRWKQISNVTTEELALAVVERAFTSQYSSIRPRVLSHPVIHKQSMHSNYITISGGFMAGFILDPFFQISSQALKKCCITDTR